MSAPETTAAELARAVGDALEARQVPYAIGGAIAYGIWAVPRATQDVDVTVFVEGAKLALAFAKARRRQVVFRDRPLWVLAPEDLAVFKMLFFRPKDLLDLERMLALMGSSFDRPYVRGWLVDMVGFEDARIVKWDELASV